MKNFKFYRVFLLVAFLSVATMAQTDFWQKINGPFGDTVNTLGINASGTICLGTNHGVFRSTDNGTNWSNVDSNLSAYRFAFNSIGDIVFAVGYIGVYGSVFRSTDDGANWTKIYDHEPISAIAINDSGHIFIGWGNEVGGGVVRSTDNGANWINTGLEANSNAIAINASGTIFSGGWYQNQNRGGVFRSTDNGVSWTNTNLPTSNYNTVTKLAINPTGHIFAVTYPDAGIFRSTDDGLHWTSITTNFWPRELVFNSSDHIFAISFSSVYRSTDDGVTWTTVNSGLTNNLLASIAINNGGIIFAATTGGLFRSVQSTTSVRELSADAPSSFSLNQNYPNPFNPTTTISFSIPTSEFVTLKVFDVLGNEVATLVNEEKSNGIYKVDFNASNLSSGIYFYTLKAGRFLETKKLILMK